MKELIIKYKSLILYAVFGVLTTLINIIVYSLLSFLSLPTLVSNTVAWVLSVLFAYFTNRKWVFNSKNDSQKAKLSEFSAFILCRLGTLLLDEIIMVVGVDVIGKKMVPMQYLSLYNLGVKTFSNVIVIILNYILSKKAVFNKKKEK